jgi:hypothetical protein
MAWKAWDGKQRKKPVSVVGIVLGFRSELRIL